MNEHESKKITEWPCFMMALEIPVISDSSDWCLKMEEIVPLIFDYVGNKYSIIGCIEDNIPGDDFHTVIYSFKLDTSLKEALREKAWFFKLSDQDIVELENVQNGVILEKMLTFDVLYTISAMNYLKEQIIGIAAMTSRILLVEVLDLFSGSVNERLLLVDSFKDLY
jgi:hypothetical protein